MFINNLIYFFSLEQSQEVHSVSDDDISIASSPEENNSIKNGIHF